MALLGATLMHDLATCGRNQKLQDVPCDYPLQRQLKEVKPDGSSVLKLGVCSDHVEVVKPKVKQVLQLFNQENEEDLSYKVDVHNTMVGANVRRYTELHVYSSPNINVFQFLIT